MRFSHTIDIEAARVWAVMSDLEPGPLARLVAWWFGDLTARYIRMEAEGLKRRAG